MTSYLKRLVNSLAAYQVADVVSKFMAVLLLPVYTRYISPAGYGVVELLGNGVIFISILVRFGIIESFLRFYFTDEDPERRDALVRAVVPVPAGDARRSRRWCWRPWPAPLSQVVLGHRDVTIFRVAVLGLWSFTNLELAYAVLRVDERLRTYAIASVTNVVFTIIASVMLVVGLGKGPEGLLLGNYGVSTLVLLALWWTMRERLRPRPGVGERLPALMRFGLPTVPAEISVYALSIVDRYYIYHDRSPREAGLYSIAVKLAGAVAFIVRAFQYAWPPLAYSIDSDAEAARLYGLVTTYYVIVSGWVVAGLALLGRWVLTASDCAVLLRGISCASVGCTRLGHVRAVGGVPGDRRPRQGDHTQLPGVAGGPRGERDPAGRAGTDVRYRRRRHRPVRRVRGDADRDAPAHAHASSAVHFEWRRLSR